MAGTRVCEPEKGRISFWQALAMIIIVGLATTDILVPTIIANLSGRDAWLAVLASTAWAVLIVALAFSLARRMGHRNVIQYAHDVLGKWAGGLVAFFYVFFFISQAALAMQNFHTIMMTVFYIKTPDIVFDLLIMLVILYAVSSGLEPVSRLNEILLPLGVGILLLVGVIALEEVTLAEFQPVLAEGAGPVFSGSLRLTVYLAQGAVIFLMLYPFIRKKGDNLLHVSLAVAALGLMMLVGVIAIGVFGVGATADMRFVALEMVRNINVGGFVQNLDALMMAIWYGGIVAKMIVLFYLACLGLAQWLGLQTYRPLLLPLGVVLAAYSSIMFANPNETVFFITMVEPGWNMTALLFIPLVLMAISFFKRQ